MKLLVALLFTGIAVAASAQEPAFNRWAIDAGFGFNKPINPYTDSCVSNTVCFPAFDLGARYSINPYFGVRLGLGYGIFKNDASGLNQNSQPFKTTYARMNLEAVANMGRVLDFHTIHPKLGLLLHAGAGISVLSNDSLKLSNHNGADQMMSFTFGIMPQFRLTDRVALTADLMALAHLFQTRTFDMRTAVSDPGLDGFVLTGTLGVSVYLGKNAVHTDWQNPEQGLLDKVLQQQSRYDSLVAAMQDSDADGVPDYSDQEPGTLPNARVTVKGVTIPESASEMPEEATETIDGFVEFPDKKGLFFTVQIGFYLNDTDLQELYGLSYYKVRTITGENRYLYTICSDLYTAQQRKDIAFERGVNDAFVAAYYQGKRITIAQAEKLLRVHGKIILQPEEE